MFDAIATRNLSAVRVKYIFLLKASVSVSIALIACYQSVNEGFWGCVIDESDSGNDLSRM